MAVVGDTKAMMGIYKIHISFKKNYMQFDITYLSKTVWWTQVIVNNYLCLIGTNIQNTCAITKCCRSIIKRIVEAS